LAAALIQSLDDGAGKFGHIGLDLESQPRLQISKVAIAVGKLMQQPLVQLEAGGRVERIHAVFFVNGLAPHDAPFILARNAALLEEIVEAAGAQHVDTLSIYL